jgi:hypothetical protein
MTFCLPVQLPQVMDLCHPDLLCHAGSARVDPPVSLLARLE